MNIYHATFCNFDDIFFYVSHCFVNIQKVIPSILTYDEYCRFIQFDGRGAQELLKSGSELFSEAKMRIDRYCYRPIVALRYKC